MTFSKPNARLIIAGLCCVSALCSAQTASLKLIGLDGATKTLGIAELQSLPQVTFVDSARPTGPISFSGPSVRSLVTLVGAPEGHALRGPNMVVVVVAEASDGYKVAYTLAELDEQFGGRQAIVALTQNGQPLSGAEGPLRIVMPREKHHARWIRQLTALRLVRAGETAKSGPNDSAKPLPALELGR